MRKYIAHLSLAAPFCAVSALIGCSSDELPQSEYLDTATTTDAGSGGFVAGTGSAPASGGAAVDTLPSGGSSSGGVGGSSGGNESGGSDGSGGQTVEGSGGAANEEPTMTPGTCKADLGGYQNGSVTYYTLSQGTAKVNCEYDEVSRNPDKLVQVKTGEGKYFGAINTEDYNTSATCGSCVEVTRDGNRKVTITVADRCPIETNPKCKKGHIDLSREAFLQLGQENEGYLGTGNGGMYGQISWKYVPCADDGTTVGFALKEADNLHWNQVLVTGHRYPIVQVEVRKGDAWIAAQRQMYNYWEPPDGDMGGDSPYRVRVTDTNGSVIEAPVKLQAGTQDSGLQFSCN